MATSKMRVPLSEQPFYDPSLGRIRSGHAADAARWQFEQMRQEQMRQEQMRLDSSPLRSPMASEHDRRRELLLLTI